MHVTMATTIRWAVFACALSSCLGALAQRAVYRCNGGSGAYISDRPCGGALAAIGPVPAPRAAPVRDRPVSKASDYLSYLSPTCAELNEGMRNGPARGLSGRALSELHTSYRERCSQDEQEARKKLAEDQKRQQAERDGQLAAASKERERDKLSREQCDEMYRIAHGKRQKVAAMSPGERADFERFEANWKARCQPS
jgi:hypothetical protein